jgi:hypothetical protein
MYQFIEGEYMRGDEYDEFIYDPGQFMMNKWIPRSFGNLAGMEQFPAMRGSMWYGWLGTVPPFADSFDLWNALETLKSAGKEIGRWFASLDQYKQEIKAEGFPISYGGWAFAPFDLLGDTLRGVRGIFIDMIRQPDKLIEAVEKMVPIWYPSLLKADRLQPGPTIRRWPGFGCIRARTNLCQLNSLRLFTGRL